MDNILEKVKIALNENNEMLIKQIEDILKQNEKPNFRTMKSGDRFFYRDIEWIYLGIEQNGALCITADCYKKMPFDKECCNNWRFSSLAEELNSEFVIKLNTRDLLPFKMNLVADNGNDAYGTSTQYVGILSCDQYRKYRKVIPLFDEWIWTCTPWYCSNSSHFASVRVLNKFGNLINVVACNCHGVVPACVFSLK